MIIVKCVLLGLMCQNSTNQKLKKVLKELQNDPDIAKIYRSLQDCRTRHTSLLRRKRVQSGDYYTGD